MSIKIRAFKDEDIKAMAEIWNDIVEDGIAFPQTEKLTEDTAKEFFSFLFRTFVKTISF